VKSLVVARQRVCPDHPQEERHVMSLRLIAALSAILFVTACGGSTSGPSPAPTPAPTGSTTVTIPSGSSNLTTTAFGMDPLVISTGTTISWLNDDSTTHTATADANQWNSGNIAPGGRFNFTFTAPGRYDYHCQLHPNMVGEIVVQ
jgi:plastocyanin